MADSSDQSRHKTKAPVLGRPLTQVAISEAKRNWPFVAGFAITFILIAKLSANLDPEADKSKFANPHGHHRE